MYENLSTAWYFFRSWKIPNIKYYMTKGNGQPKNRSDHIHDIFKKCLNKTDFLLADFSVENQPDL